MTLKQVILCPCASDKQGEACVPPPCSMGYIYIYTYLYISSISPTSSDPFFFSRRGEKENLALFLFAKQASSRWSTRGWSRPTGFGLKIHLEPLFLVSPGKSVAANECFKKNTKVDHIPAARGRRPFSRRGIWWVPAIGQRRISAPGLHCSPPSLSSSLSRSR